MMFGKEGILPKEEIKEFERSSERLLRANRWG